MYIYCVNKGCKETAIASVYFKNDYECIFSCFPPYISRFAICLFFFKVKLNRFPHYGFNELAYAFMDFRYDLSSNNSLQCIPHPLITRRML